MIPTKKKLTSLSYTHPVSWLNYLTTFGGIKQPNIQELAKLISQEHSSPVGKLLSPETEVDIQQSHPLNRMPKHNPELLYYCYLLFVICNLLSVISSCYLFIMAVI